MRATDITGRIAPDMCYIVQPMPSGERKGIVEEAAFATPTVLLRVRQDLKAFRPVDHAALGVSPLVEAVASGADCVPVIVRRRNIKAYNGTQQVLDTIDISLDGTPVEFSLALSILDRYPTLIEEAPEREPVAPKGKRS